MAGGRLEPAIPPLPSLALLSCFLVDPGPGPERFTVRRMSDPRPLRHHHGGRRVTGTIVVGGVGMRE